MLVRIVGLMRSGTNLLTWMLRQNFVSVQTATMLLGWKHGPIYRDRTALAFDEFVDPRYRQGLRNFVRDHPADWARVTSHPLFLAAAEQQRAQSFGVALAVRDPALWYASCLRISREVPGFLPHGTEAPAAAAYWNARHRDWLATLGERSAIVNTDTLRTAPELLLAAMAVGLKAQRRTELRTPRGYLHPQGTEELYELLGAPVPEILERQLTTPEAVEPERQAEFAALLDPDLLARLGLGTTPGKPGLDP